MCDCGKCIERKMREFFKKELEKLKWKNLPKEERKGAIRAYRMMGGKNEEQFKSDYVEWVEFREEKRMDENMPFSDY